MRFRDDPEHVWHGRTKVPETQSGDRREILADMIDAGRDALRRGDPEVLRWAKRWLGWSSRPALRKWLVEATWIVLHNPEGLVEPGPPTALPVTAEPIVVRRTAGMWQSPPRNPAAYLTAAIRTEAAKLQDLYGDSEQLGYADLERRQVNLRAVSRRESEASWEREKRADLDQLGEKAAEPVAFGPPGLALRAMERFTKSERERHYLLLLSFPAVTKVDARREAGITTSEATALAARIKRGAL